MTSQVVYVSLTVVSAALIFAAAMVGWQKRTAAGASAFFWMLLGLGVWTIAYILELTRDQPAEMITWGKIAYIGIAAAPTAWLIFAIQYTGNDAWLTRRNTALLGVIPVLTLLLTWTNEWHHLIWQHIDLDPTADFPILNYTHGYFFWVHVTYSYIITLIGTSLLLRLAFRTPRLYRYQLLIMATASVMPLLGNIIYLIRPVALQFFDPTPLAFSLTCSLFTWSVFRFHLLNIVPVARHKVLESIDDGVIVVDVLGRIVDVNAVALRFMQIKESDLIGRKDSEVLAPWGDLVTRFREVADANTEVVIGEGDNALYIEIRILPLRESNGRLSGRVCLFRDITLRRRAEAAAHEDHQFLSAIMETTAALVLVLDCEGRIVRFNQACERLTGYTAAEVMGKHFWDIFIVDEELESIKQVFGTLVDGKVPNYHENYWRLKDDELRWITWSNTALFDGQKRVRYVIGTGVDITERKKVEEDLRLSKELYQDYYAKEQRQSQELVLLSRARTALARELDQPQLIRKIVEAVAETFSYHLVSLYLLEGDTLVLQHQIGYDTVIERVSIDEGVIGRCIRTRTPILLEDVSADPAFKEAISGIVSEIAVPLFNQGQVIGVLNVESTNNVRLTQNDLRMLIALGENLNIAIERAHLYGRLRESETRYRQMIENASDVAYTINIRGFFTYVSPSVKRLMGYMPDELIGVHFTTLVPEDWRRLLVVFYQQQLDDGTRETTLEFPVITKTGETRWVEQVVTLIGTIQPLGFHSFVRDVTERQQAQEALGRQNEYLAALHETTLGLINHLDLTDLLETIIERAAQLVGTSHGYIYLMEGDDQIEMKVGIGVFKERVGIHLKMGAGVSGKVWETGELLVVDDYDTWSLRLPDVQTNTFHAIAALPLRSTSQVIGVIGLAHSDSQRTFGVEDVDVLSRFAQLAALALDNARLYEESRQQLIETQKLYNQVSELEQLKTQIIRMAAHDLNNPLAMLKGYLQLMEKKGMDIKEDEFKLYVQEMKTVSENMLHITKGILSLERINAMRRQPGESVDLRQISQQIVSENIEWGRQKSQEITAQLPEAPVLVKGDRLQLYEAMTNLVGNAIKYTPPGGEVRVCLETKDHQAIFEVHDTGFGVPELQQAQLFQPFARVTTRETHAIEGNGLGLYLVKNVVERHGGLVRFHSVYQQGSTFGFELPLLV